MRKTPEEILDWTVSDTPFVEEPETQPAEAAPAPHRALKGSLPSLFAPRRVAFIMFLAAAVVLLAVWAGTAWGEYQLKQEIQTLVNAEEYDVSPDEFFAPRDFELPLPLLSPPILSGTVQSLTRLNPELLRADVRRTFIDQVTQTEAVFIQPQFYHRTEAGWARTPPPDDFWGSEVLERGVRLTFRYPQVDSEFVTALAPTLEKTLASACQIWQCPPVNFTMQWVEDDAETLTLASFPAGYGGFWPGSLGSRTLSLGAGSTFIFTGPEQITLPSPHAIGLPADAASQQLYADTVSLMLLRQLALRLSGNKEVALDYQNPFRIALVARMAARLGLDNTRIPELLNPNPHREDDELWRMGDLDENTLRSSLVITNRLLQTQTFTTEAKLLKTLATADGVLSWLVDGLNLTTKEAVELSQTVNYQPWPIENLAANAGEILLTCADGLQVWRNNQAAPEPLLTGYFPGSFPGVFSPDGQKLMARISGQLAVVDFSTGTLIWLPNGYSAYNGQWLDNKTLAYELFGDAVGVRLYELYVGDVLAFDSDIRNYTLSPDRQLAVITRYPNNDTVLSLMPSHGGEEKTIGSGFDPLWSPAGDAIAFGYATSTQKQIKIFILVQDEEYIVMGDNRLGKDYTASVKFLSPGLVTSQWSPTGEWLAFYYATMEDRFIFNYWVGLVERDGEGMRFVIEDWEASQSLQPFTFSGFSADGNYFAIPKPGEGVLLHHITNNKTRMITIDNLREGQFQWSPTGYDILISTAQGIQILRDARQANPRLESISGPDCTSAIWVPSPQP